MLTPHLLVHHIMFITKILNHGFFLVVQRYSNETKIQVKKILNRGGTGGQGEQGEWGNKGNKGNKGNGGTRGTGERGILDLRIANQELKRILEVRIFRIEK